MSFSIQTNVTSLIAQDNLRVNSNFQSQTIQRLTSGYRINSSADDAAGLSIANSLRSNITELSQGVRNASDGVNQLQIADGGLNQISHILDRLKTLATQSASQTFTGDRSTLNTEYSSLLSEIDRQANNIKLNTGGALNSSLTVYIGGAVSSANPNAQVSVNLSGASNAVDSTSLALSNSSVLGGANQVVGGGVDLRTTPSVLAAGGSQAFAVNYTDSNGTATTSTVTVKSVAGGISVNNALGQINSQLSGLGVSASVNQSTGFLQFGGSKAFSINATGTAVADGLVGNAATITSDNKSLYTVTGANPTGTSATESFSLVTSSNQTVQFTFASEATAAAKVSNINKVSTALGITASVDSAGNVQLSSTSAFTAVQTVADGTAGNNTFGAGVGNLTVGKPTVNTTDTGNATSALSAIQSAVQQLGLVQGVVGAGQNKLQYAINLAQSQISNFSAAQSTIRDADVASEAANLTKAQVLQQTSLAALAQANSAPQAILSLLKG